ncbi:type II toxin-antitoxin system antitoxin DNA ADP-ribosyl glycohydrolase DarG [Rufibacter quisquiliarum]|uniref:O-acetyl-ADP-ribose deacetylase (Regulator of RNase III)/uncharacterized protein YwgA n=1 Tax=Rufibacter quisquiliarum TaxID=1549639 RepID=A0A839H1Q3_9BACT|nr:macro domain-containing protein [Rufibacter quisquiliarum]MBA9079811.1 O-acetyl-ADP-ribose deacetylase (regulator of RNase III)/uncharacterized protein YwgA [Rufibacter quisquiliarum]
MIEYKTGNILKANTQALINTVNCEGYMGKGIAYQFKLEYPENNEAYIKACKSGELKVGSIFPFKEEEKIIINFPTKDKWREKSKYEYIESGIKSLKAFIINENIISIAIPPLGCGNGGLKWPVVKEIILDQLECLANKTTIEIYEPSDNIVKENKSNRLPKLNASHLLLMELKLRLEKFNKIRLQKTAYLINYLSNQNYFKFDAHHFGPYAHSLEILSKDIKEYQMFYGFDTEKAYKHAKTVLISDSILAKEKIFLPFVEKATEITNHVLSDKELELLTTLLFLIEKRNLISAQDLVKLVKDWSEYKADTFSEEQIMKATNELLEKRLIQKELYGLRPNKPSQ